MPPELLSPPRGLCGHGTTAFPSGEVPQAEVPTGQCRVMPQSLKANSVPGNMTHIALFNPQTPTSHPCPQKP